MDLGGWEVPLMIGLQNLLGEQVISILSHLSVFGEEVMLTLVIGFLYWGYDKEYGKYIGETILSANVWNAMLKNVVNRRRPYFDHEAIKAYRLVEPKADPYDIAAQGYSFPSGHSANSLACYGSLARYADGMKKNTALPEKERARVLLVARILFALAFIMPFLVGLSRVIVGVHYPTDVLCGWALGLVAIFLVPFLREKLGRKWSMILILVTAFLGVFYCRSDDYFASMGLLAGFYGATCFEKRFVNFKSTKVIPMCLLRLACGLLVFLGVNLSLKALISLCGFADGSFAAHMARLIRYTIVTFACFGIYPMAFRFAERKK